MAGFKTGISKLYARARDRAYTAIYTKQGRTDRGLRSSVALKNRESGNRGLRWSKCVRVSLRSEESGNVRVTDKLLERSRVSLVRTLGALMTKDDYLLRYPIITHQILRHHGLATGSDAGRISSGMSHSFGTAFALAANLKPGQSCIEIYMAPKIAQHLPHMRDYLTRLRSCFPFKGKVVVEKLSKNQLLHS